MSDEPKRSLPPTLDEQLSQAEMIVDLRDELDALTEKYAAARDDKTSALAQVEGLHVRLERALAEAAERITDLRTAWQITQQASLKLQREYVDMKHELKQARAEVAVMVEAMRH